MLDFQPYRNLKITKFNKLSGFMKKRLGSLQVVMMDKKEIWCRSLITTDTALSLIFLVNNRGQIPTFIMEVDHFIYTLVS